jgi:hypothetical protein
MASWTGSMQPTHGSMAPEKGWITVGRWFRDGGLRFNSNEGAHAF